MLVSLVCMSIAENLRRLRKREKLSQTALAEKAGVAQQLISQIEQGKNVTTRKLPQLAKALNCYVEDIDPNYYEVTSRDRAELIEKFNQILEESDEGGLRLLDEHLNFLMSRQDARERSSE